MPRYLAQVEAERIDERLMSPHDGGFSLAQLMELAGLSCACAIRRAYKDTEAPTLALIGPGNNGGDGLVALRHLASFGYHNLQAWIPKPPAREYFPGLIRQAQNSGVDVVVAKERDNTGDRWLREIQEGVIVDALFGFGYRGSLRAPYDSVMGTLIDVQGRSGVKVASIDVPSGWHVERGDETGSGLKPDVLISLTAPKRCATSFKGSYHFLGGRFVPRALEEELNLSLPSYPGDNQCVLLDEDGRACLEPFPESACLKMPMEPGGTAQ